MPVRLRDLPQAEVRTSLLSGSGLGLRLGPYVARVQTSLPQVAQAVEHLYAHHVVEQADAFVDFDVAVRRAGGARRWWKPQVVFEFDGAQPFNPLPGDQGLPLLEWGLNWCVYGQCHQHLTLHAAVLERNGRALLLPAPSGSGKSTLCAALLHSGWRLLSDELTLIRPRDGAVLPLPRPVSLKNASIEVIREFVPGLQFGSMVHETTKGRVAHFAPPAEAVAATDVPALPGWIVFPRYQAGAPADLTPIERAQAFMQLVQNAFNYDVYGREGFELLARVVGRSRCFSFSYGSLATAVPMLRAMADENEAPGDG